MRVRKPKKNNKKAIIIILLMITLLTIATILLIICTPKPKTTTNTTQPNNSSSNINSGATSSPKDNSQTTPAIINSDTTPIEPTGTFISNHHPNLSGNPAPNTESSTCTTTPGADCEIRFTNGNTTKSLSIKKTDSDGNASWDWNLNDVGLTAGEWSITAIAINGSKTATATDSMSLSVGQ
ncbi:MAG: hypothetical protein WCJ36_01375 [Candidatus Saccharibacteria bacterium]